LRVSGSWNIVKCKLCCLLGCDTVWSGKYLRFCGLVVMVSGYKSRCLGSIPCAVRFSEKRWVRNGVHPTSWVQSVTLTTRHPLSAKISRP
jgi:hypothetical protein